MRFLSPLIPLLLACLLAACLIPCADADDRATPQDIIRMVNKAVEFLAAKGPAGLAAFNDPLGPWMFKDTYVFVFDCNKQIMAAHPNSALVGEKLTDLVDKHGNYLGLELCRIAQKPDGGWREYWWPRANEHAPEHKISYILNVPGQPYSAIAGLYKPQWTEDELNALLK